MPTGQNIQPVKHPGFCATNPIDIPLAAVWSRKVDFNQLAGRPRMILAVRRAMTETCSTEHLYLNNLLERHNLSSVFWTVFSFVSELLRGRLPSLQCLLFADRSNHRQLRKKILELKPTTLYCDGVRSYHFLRRLGAARNHMRIVVDMDDFMSRRMKMLKQSGLGLSLGYLKGRVPTWVIRLLTHPLFARIVAGWEGAALQKVEDDLGRWAQAVVLLSPVEGASLADQYIKSRACSHVQVIPPPIEIVEPPKRYPHFGRFIFIGTDALPQNHSTITRLIDLWTCLKPASELHIFGSMSHEWPETAGVVFRGYAPDLAQVYIEGSVLLAPGALRGGIKTKVIEAFANGCAVVGDSITFEGLGLENYPLFLQNELDLKELILNPQAHLDMFCRAAFSGQQHVAETFCWDSFIRAWQSVLQVEYTRNPS